MNDNEPFKVMHGVKVLYKNKSFTACWHYLLEEFGDNTVADLHRDRIYVTR
jgi:hypothetical protein